MYLNPFPSIHDKCRLLLQLLMYFGSLYCNSNRDFPKSDLGPNIGPFQFKNEQKLPKMVYIIPNFSVLHFGENFSWKCEQK